MKSYDEMYDLILKTAMEDDRIRAVTMEGSNVTKGAVHDEFSEPRTVLVNKDDYKELVEITSKECFYIKKPTEFEFFGTVNEFRWMHFIGKRHI